MWIILDIIVRVAMYIGVPYLFYKMVQADKAEAEAEEKRQ